MTAYKTFRSYRRNNNPARKINRLSHLMSGPRRNRAASAPVLPTPDNTVIIAEEYADQLMAWYSNGIENGAAASMDDTEDTEDTTDDFAEEHDVATGASGTALPFTFTSGTTAIPPTSTPTAQQTASIPLSTTNVTQPAIATTNPSPAIVITPSPTIVTIVKTPTVKFPEAVALTTPKSKPTKVAKFPQPSLTDEITDDIDVRHPLSATANMNADDIARLALAKATATCPMQKSSKLDTIDLMDDDNNAEATG